MPLEQEGPAPAAAIGVRRMEDARIVIDQVALVHRQVNTVGMRHKRRVRLVGGLDFRAVGGGQLIVQLYASQVCAGENT